MGQPSTWITKPSALAADLRATAKRVAAFRAANPFRTPDGKPLPPPAVPPLRCWHESAMTRTGNYSDMRANFAYASSRRRVRGHCTRPRFGGTPTGSTR